MHGSISSICTDRSPDKSRSAGRYHVDGVSASTIAITATKCDTHILKINGHSQTKLLVYGTAIKSGTFKAGAYTWCIVTYPNGRSDDDDDGITLGLKLVTGSRDLLPACAHVGFTLVPPDHLQGGSKPATKVSFRAIFDRAGNICVDLRPLITRAELEKSEYLVDDSLVVRCDVTVVDISTVRDEVVQAFDLERTGMACSCEDDLCKRPHASNWVFKSETAPAKPPPSRRRGIKAAWFRLVRRAPESLASAN